MRCPKCQTENKESSNFCSHCGAALGEKAPLRQRRTRWFCFFVVLLVLGGSFLYLSRYSLTPVKKDVDKEQTPSSSPATSDLETPNSSKTEGLTNQAIERTLVPERDRADAFFSLPVGWVAIKNRWGMEISKIPAAVINGAWIALPVRACLGGEIWLFRPGKEDEARLNGGRWRDGDPVGLWRLEEGKDFKSPKLSPWEENAPLEWLALKPGSSPLSVRIDAVSSEGDFLKADLAQPIHEPGVFIQNNRVVGWTFGLWLDGGYLWGGSGKKSLEDEIEVEYFYSLTFAGGREEQFSKALAMPGESPPMDRLRAFVDGFLFSPKLLMLETPAILGEETILGTMHSLTSTLISEGFSREVADLLTDSILLEASDPTLLLDGTLATAKSYGYERALDLLERLEGYIEVDQGKEIPEVEKMQRHLYQNWINTFLEKGETEDARRVFERGSGFLHDVPEWHLLGVELELALGDWAEAKRLLKSGDYPSSLKEKVRLLEARITELRAEAEKVIIGFPPGSRMIRVRAVLDGSVAQDFFIDTGASMVTVPYSAVEALGIELHANLPRRRVSTAGGIKIAREIMIPSIELEGWIEHHVKALVLDIPNQLGYGLLGLNYLRRFQIEVDNEKGLLMLRPR